LPLSPPAAAAMPAIISSRFAAADFSLSLSESLFIFDADI